MTQRCNTTHYMGCECRESLITDLCIAAKAILLSAGPDPETGESRVTTSHLRLLGLALQKLNTVRLEDDSEG